jgi:hypothetical protein
MPTPQMLCSQPGYPSDIKSHVDCDGLNCDGITLALGECSGLASLQPGLKVGLPGGKVALNKTITVRNPV